MRFEKFSNFSKEFFRSHKYIKSQIKPYDSFYLAFLLLPIYNLKELRIYFNIRNEGASALANALPASLRSLELSSNQIGDEGVTALANALPASLRSLWLNHNQIGDEGDIILENIKQEKKEGKVKKLRVIKFPN